MEKNIQDNSSTDSGKVSGQDPDRYEQGYGSFTKEDFEKDNKDESTKHETPGGTVTGTSDKANNISTLNENDSTISNQSAPSGTVSGEEETNSNAS